jgi:thioredoxin-like negative regulator of GroEL
MVLWLNETHNYLGGTNGETVAAWLRTQLDGSRSGRIVVLGTLWPQYWAELVAQPAPGHHDVHAHVRALLQHVVRRVRVADRFSSEHVAALITDRSIDPRMAIAATTSGAGRRVIQTLAGGPALVERYEHPDHPDDRYAAAIVTAAIDARRLSYESPLTADLLTDAAAGYLSDEDRIDPPPDWCERGLARATKDSLHGITALIPVRTRPGTGPADGYNLHDYLEQHGRTTRRDAVAPPTLWQTFVTQTDDPDDQWRLARAAYQRLLYRYADPLYQRWSRSTASMARVRFIDDLVDYGRADEALRVLADRGNTARLSSLTHGGRTLERLIEYGRIDNVLAVFEGYLRAGGDDPAVGRRLTACLIGLRRTDEAAALLRKVVDLVDKSRLDASWHQVGHQGWANERLAELLAQQQRTDELRQRADSGDPYAGRRLADLLADQGHWEAALRQLDSGAWWTRTWLAQRLAKAGQLDTLRRLCQFGDDFETRELLVEALLTHDHVDEAMLRLPGLRHGAPPRPPSDRLIDLLVNHGRVDEAVELLLRPEWMGEPQATWTNFLERMTARGRREEIIPLLRQLVASDDPVAVSLRVTLQELLADQLAGQDRWAEVLELLKDAGSWAQSWLARQLARLGRVDHLRRLAKSGHHSARGELVDLLLAQGRDEEAVAVLRTVADGRPRRGWDARQLAKLLIARGDFTEVHTRIAKGDNEAAQALVEYAYRGKLPDAEQFLATGLGPDGSLDTSWRRARTDGAHEGAESK